MSRDKFLDSPIPSTTTDSVLQICLSVVRVTALCYPKPTSSFVTRYRSKLSKDVSSHSELPASPRRNLKRYSDLSSSEGPHCIQTIAVQIPSRPKWSLYHPHRLAGLRYAATAAVRTLAGATLKASQVPLIQQILHSVFYRVLHLKDYPGLYHLETWQWTPILVPLRVFKSTQPSVTQIRQLLRRYRAVKIYIANT